MTQVSDIVYHDYNFNNQCRKFYMDFITINILASNYAGSRWSLSRQAFQLAMTQVSDGVYIDQQFS
jgi:hypothetical protein